MSSSKAKTTNSISNGNPPALPPNVTIFSPALPSTIQVLQTSSLFTRMRVGANTSPSDLADALSTGRRYKVDETFCLRHQNIILIFDSASEEKDLQDAHHEHFRSVCLLLRDHDITVDVAACVYDATTALQASFQFEKLNSVSILIIDLMSEGDSSDEEDGSLDDVDE